MSLSSPPITPLAHSPAEVAFLLGISREKVYRLIADNTIPSIKLGSRRLVKHESLLSFLDDHEGGSAA